MDRKTLLAAYAHLDRFETAGFVSHFVDGGTMTVGNAPPCVGAPAIRAALDSQLSLLDGLHHEMVDTWHVDHGWMLEASATYRVRGVAAPVVIRAAHVIRTERGLIRDLRVYADLAPLFAAAEDVDPAAKTGLAIRHVDDGARGAFLVEPDGRRLAEMTYRYQGSSVAAFTHTWVSDDLRGQGMATRLLDEAVRWARGSDVRILPLCSFVRGAFARDPSLRDVLAT